MTNSLSNTAMYTTLYFEKITNKLEWTLSFDTVPLAAGTKPCNTLTEEDSNRVTINCKNIL